MMRGRVEVCPYDKKNTLTQRFIWIGMINIFLCESARHHRNWNRNKRMLQQLSAIPNTGENHATHHQIAIQWEFFKLLFQVNSLKQMSYGSIQDWFSNSDITLCSYIACRYSGNWWISRMTFGDEMESKLKLIQPPTRSTGCQYVPPRQNSITFHISHTITKKEKEKKHTLAPTHPPS
jgi:hypothetical protein